MCHSDDDAQHRTSGKLSQRADLFKRFGTGGWHAWVFDHVLAAGLPDDARIADIGGGPGWLWQQNATRIPVGWRVTHTDLSPGMLANARANIARPGSAFAVVDTQSLAFADEREPYALPCAGSRASDQGICSRTEAGRAALCNDEWRGAHGRNSWAHRSVQSSPRRHSARVAKTRLHA